MKKKTANGLFSFGMLLAAMVFPAVTAPAGNANPDKEKVIETLIADYDNEESAGGAILVMRDNEVIFSRGFGMANLECAIPFTDDTPNNIGSTAKQFTAFAIAMLEQQGKVSVEDDIRKYIPELPAFEDTVRIRHLIAHTSGYREFINTLAMGGWQLGDNVGREEVITVLQRQPELQSKPGDEYNYNNSGYALLSMVVERATETPFPEWMKTNVFDPLGMNRTLVLENPGQIIPGRALGYYAGKGDRLTGVADMHASIGAGGIYSTVNDLAKWAANFYAPVLGDAELITRLQKDIPFNSGESSGYAFGLILSDLHGQKMVYHPGGDLAHRSNFMLFPEIQGLVTVQSNYAGFPIQMAERVAETFFADAMDVEKPDHETGEGTFVYDVLAFDEIAGRYELETMPGFVLEFTREEHTLYARATGQPPFEIHASSDSTFYMTVVDASMTFHRNEEGEIHAMTLHQSGDHFGRRITEPAWVPESDDLAMYVGRYFNEELETFYSIVADEESNLTLQHRRLDDIPLKAESRDTYTGSFPITGLAFVRDENDQVAGFVASSGRTTGIFFEKQ